MKRTYYGKKTILLLAFLAVFLLAACGKKKQGEASEPEEYLVVINKTDMTHVKVAYEISSGKTEDAVSELLEALGSYTDDEYMSPLSDKAVVRSWAFSDGMASVYFESSYYDLVITDEVLMRAAIVETLCQLENVEDVSFFVDDAPLTIQGTVIGRMNSNSFLYDMAASNETTKVVLYYPDESLEGLAEVTREVKIDARYTDEQLVLEELLKGPQSGEGAVRAVPDGTRLLNVVTKDMVCYVNLSADFLTYSDNMPDTFTVYSIVNSLSEISGVSSVVISVEGQKLEYYRTVYCGDLLTCNYDLLMNEEK